MPLRCSVLRAPEPECDLRFVSRIGWFLERVGSAGEWHIAVGKHSSLDNALSPGGYGGKVSFGNN
jgi:hypothetical protein